MKPIPPSKTHKQVLYKKWWWTSLCFGSALFAVVASVFIWSNPELMVLFVPLILLLIIFGGLKCPNCHEVLAIPPGTRSFDSIHYCSKCGFNLDTAMEETPSSQPRSEP